MEIVEDWRVVANQSYESFTSFRLNWPAFSVEGHIKMMQEGLLKVTG